jgi:hypothetical protein
MARNFISQDLACMVEATAQAVADARALMRWLMEQGTPAVGVWGFSLGAWLAGLLASHEPLLRAAALTTPVVNISRVVRELPFCAPIQESLRINPVELDRLSLLSHKPERARDRVLILESVHDLFVPPDTVEELWRAWDRPEIWRIAHGHISIWLAPRLLRRVARWLGQALKSDG